MADASKPDTLPCTSMDGNQLDEGLDSPMTNEELQDNQPDEETDSPMTNKELEDTESDEEEDDVTDEELKVACQSLLVEMIEDTTLGVCFDVHRALKFGQFPIGKKSQKKNGENDSNVFVDALFRAASEYALKNPPLINCPHCNKIIPADATFTQHLASCVNGANNQTRELPKRSSAKPK